mmetsp:Transcript_12650/g.39919  ORF Transcript_12650/g.39919 Transcript_12650/m.39919 type:complete len:508 (+) Transcript_12650:674-2197(+)
MNWWRHTTMDTSAFMTAKGMTIGAMVAKTSPRRRMRSELGRCLLTSMGMGCHMFFLSLDVRARRWTLARTVAVGPKRRSSMGRVMNVLIMMNVIWALEVAGTASPSFSMRSPGSMPSAMLLIWSMIAAAKVDPRNTAKIMNWKNLWEAARSCSRIDTTPCRTARKEKSGGRMAMRMTMARPGRMPSINTMMALGTCLRMLNHSSRLSMLVKVLMTPKGTWNQMQSHTVREATTSCRPLRSHARRPMFCQKTSSGPGAGWTTHWDWSPWLTTVEAVEAMRRLLKVTKAEREGRSRASACSLASSASRPSSSALSFSSCSSSLTLFCAFFSSVSVLPISHGLISPKRPVKFSRSYSRRSTLSRMLVVFWYNFSTSATSGTITTLRTLPGKRSSKYRSTSSSVADPPCARPVTTLLRRPALDFIPDIAPDDRSPVRSLPMLRDLLRLLLRLFLRPFLPPALPSSFSSLGFSAQNLSSSSLSGMSVTSTVNTSPGGVVLSVSCFMRSTNML